LILARSGAAIKLETQSLPDGKGNQILEDIPVGLLKEIVRA
jgi:hypothetical protein